MATLMPREEVSELLLLEEQLSTALQWFVNKEQENTTSLLNIGKSFFAQLPSQFSKYIREVTYENQIIPLLTYKVTPSYNDGETILPQRTLTFKLITGDVIDNQVPILVFTTHMHEDNWVLPIYNHRLLLREQGIS